MSSIITRVLRQKAVYWQQLSGARNDNGEPTFLPPVEIKCRWVDKFELIEKSNTETLQIASKVMVDRDVKEGDYLKLGTIDSDTPNDPTEITSSFPVAMFKKVPDIRDRNQYRVAYLSNKING